MKFGQLIQYNMSKVFPEKLCIECGGEASPRLFRKKSKSRISLDQQPDMTKSLFLLHVQIKSSKMY